MKWKVYSRWQSIYLDRIVTIGAIEQVFVFCISHPAKCKNTLVHGKHGMKLGLTLHRINMAC